MDLGAGFGVGVGFGFGAGAGSGVGTVGVGTVVAGGVSCARALDGMRSPKAIPVVAASTDAPMANVRATRDKRVLLLPVTDPNSPTDCRS